MAQTERVSSAPLLRDGSIIDEIVAEFPSADVEPAGFCRRMGQSIVAHLDDLSSVDPETRYARRVTRYQTLGQRQIAEIDRVSVP